MGRIQEIRKVIRQDGVTYVTTDKGAVISRWIPKKICEALHSSKLYQRFMKAETLKEAKQIVTSVKPR